MSKLHLTKAILATVLVSGIYTSQVNVVKAEETPVTSTEKESGRIFEIDMDDQNPQNTLKKEIIQEYIEKNPTTNISDIDMDASTIQMDSFDRTKSGLQTLNVCLSIVVKKGENPATSISYTENVTVKLKQPTGPQIILKANEVQIKLGSSFNYADNIGLISTTSGSLPVLQEVDNVDVNTEGTYTVNITAIDQLGNKSYKSFTVNVINEDVQTNTDQQSTFVNLENDAYSAARLTAEQSLTPSVTYASLPAMGSGNDVVSFALSLVGSAYTYGGSSPLTGFDCSGFTQYVYSQFGINLPHSSDAQSTMGTLVDPSQAQPGDLVTYYGHSAIYIGDGLIVNALNPGAGVNVLGMYSLHNGGLQVHRLG